MPYSYKISPSGRHVEIVGTDEITTADCLNMIKVVISDPSCLADYTTLIDLSHATYITRDKAEVIQIATALEENRPALKNKIAIVAQRATLFHAELLARHVRDATDVEIRVFVDRAAGEAFCRESQPI